MPRPSARQSPTEERHGRTRSFTSRSKEEACQQLTDQDPIDRRHSAGERGVFCDHILKDAKSHSAQSHARRHASCLCRLRGERTSGPESQLGRGGKFIGSKGSSPEHPAENNFPWVLDSHTDLACKGQAWAWHSGDPRSVPPMRARRVQMDCTRDLRLLGAGDAAPSLHGGRFGEVLADGFAPQLGAGISVHLCFTYLTGPALVCARPSHVTGR